MSCACAPSLVALRDEVNALFLRRDKASDGCCGDAAHAARKSDHNPTNGFAHALDIDEDIEPGRDLLWLVPILLDDSRTKYVIYEGLIFYRSCATHGVGRCPGHKYTGVNAHLHHLHLSIVSSATHDRRRWIPSGTTLTPPAPAPAPVRQEDDDLAADPHGTARMLFRIYLGRNPNDGRELDLHVLRLVQIGLNARCDELSRTPEGLAWAKREAA